MLNRVVLIGRLVADPELKYTASSIPFTQLRIAVDRPMSAEARSSGQAKQTDFINIAAWRKTAEFAANYLGKGRLVAVEGRLQVREYETQDGQKRRDYEVVADNVQGLDRPKDGSEGGYSGQGGGGGGYSTQAQGGGGYDEAPARPAPQRPAPAANQRPAPASSGAASYAEDDIDDPFADN